MTNKIIIFDSLKLNISILIWIICFQSGCDNKGSNVGDIHVDDTIPHDTIIDSIADSELIDILIDTRTDTEIDTNTDVDLGYGLGAPCETEEDCSDVPGEAVCLLAEHPDGYCSSPCEAEIDCGMDGHCTYVPMGNYCYLSCKEDEDCIRDGFTCSGGENGVCVAGGEL
jgi:hypothetical protein